MAFCQSGSELFQLLLQMHLMFSFLLERKTFDNLALVNVLLAARLVKNNRRIVLLLHKVGRQQR